MYKCGGGEGGVEEGGGRGTPWWGEQVRTAEGWGRGEGGRGGEDAVQGEQVRAAEIKCQGFDYFYLTWRVVNLLILPTVHNG